MHIERKTSMAQSKRLLTPIRELWTKNPQIHWNSYPSFWQIGVNGSRSSRNDLLTDKRMDFILNLES